MGQANSTGAADAQTRRRSRPLSWAPGLLASSQPNDDTVPELLHRAPDTPSRSRPSTTRISNRLSSHFGRHDAGSSAPEDAPVPSRSRSRLHRARSSLSSMTGLLSRRPPLPARNTEPTSGFAAPSTPNNTVPSRAALRHTASDRGPFLPRVQVPELGLDFDQLLRTNSQAERPDGHRQRPLVPLSPLRRDGRALSIIPSQRRLRNMIGHPRRRRSLWQDGENMDNVQQLRQGEDQADVLSRLLSLAAAATAASLVGDDNQAATRDGTFDTFLQSLQNGSIASALRGNEDGQGVDNPGAAQAPLNFFRMFRFGTSTDNARNDTTGRGGSSSGNGGTEGEEDGEGRMVPIIIVGIRSIQPGSGTGQEDASIPPFLDALSSFPTPPTSPGDTNANILQPPQNGTRFSHRRRASMGGFNFPSNYDSQRHHRGTTQERSRPWSSVTDSPPGLLVRLSSPPRKNHKHIPVTLGHGA